VSPPTLPKKDLIVLVADIDQENALKGLFGRHQSLKTRPFTFEIKVHADHDAGCRTQGPAFLRDFTNSFQHALLIFDHEGSGGEKLLPTKLESTLDTQLSINGWEENARCIVIAPEIEAWVWGESINVDEILGWTPLGDLRGWMRGEGWLDANAIKPSRPKEALKAAMKQVGRTPKAPLFRKLAEKVSFQNCTDRAFVRLLTTLQTWFPASTPEEPS
jgi:hypothetical protein